jgi:hypothetical protein
VISVLAAALISAAVLALASSASMDDSGWRPVLRFDEVAVHLDASTVEGDGPYTVQLRWSFAARDASPRAWDAGVRYSIDVVDIDCRAGATRTRGSTAFQANGDLVPTLSFEEVAPTWSRHAPESMGALLAREACTVLRARVSPPA